MRLSLVCDLCMFGESLTGDLVQQNSRVTLVNGVDLEIRVWLIDKR